MLKNFWNQSNPIGRLVVVLLLAGGLVFAGVFSGFVVQPEASSCSCGGTDAPSTLSSSCPSGANGCNHPNNCDGCPPKGESFCSGGKCCGPAD